jgi:hypothetical protein
MGTGRQMAIVLSPLGESGSSETKESLSSMTLYLFARKVSKHVCSLLMSCEAEVALDAVYRFD